MGGTRRYTTAQDLEARLGRFEHKFAMSSEQFIRDFESGELAENEDFLEWWILYDAWAAATEKRS